MSIAARYPQEIYMTDVFAPFQKEMLESFQNAFQYEGMLFQLVDMFPLPIETFLPDGTTVYGNRAALHYNIVSGLDQVVGINNLLKDPVVNDVMGLREYVRRAFEGEAGDN